MKNPIQKMNKFKNKMITNVKLIDNQMLLLKMKLKNYKKHLFKKIYN